MANVSYFEWLQIGSFVFTAGGLAMYLRTSLKQNKEKINELAHSNNEINTVCYENKEEINNIKFLYVPRDEAYKNFVKSEVMDLKLDVITEKIERNLDGNNHLSTAIDDVKRMIEHIQSNKQINKKGD